MTKEAALYVFFSGFGIPAYKETDVPADARRPYLTYPETTGAFGDPPVSIAANLYYDDGTGSLPNAKVREISQYLGLTVKILPCDEGYIWIRRGSPWCQNLTEQGDITIQRRYLNFEVEYTTAY